MTARKLSPVVKTDRGAEVCQDCLVRWARQTVRVINNSPRYLCNRCYSKPSQVKPR